MPNNLLTDNMYDKAYCLKFKIKLMCFASIFNLIFKGKKKKKKRLAQKNSVEAAKASP